MGSLMSNLPFADLENDNYIYLIIQIAFARSLQVTKYVVFTNFTPANDGHQSDLGLPEPECSHVLPGDSRFS